MNFRSELRETVERLNRLNDKLGKYRNEYLKLEAERKHFDAKLTASAEGKSHAEKVTNGQGKLEYLEFHKRLARAKAEYEHVELQLSILEKEYQAVYLETKIDQQIINKQEK